MKLAFIALQVAFVLSGAALNPTPSISQDQPKDAQVMAENNPSLFQPEDLAILIPARQKGQSAFEAKTLDDLQKFFVPMSAVVSKQFYTSVLEALRTARFVREIEGKLKEEKSLLDIDRFRKEESRQGKDIEHWYVTGIRFRPCVSPLPVPEGWLEEPGRGQQKLRDLICRPRVRLSVQRFGLLHGRITSDDKAFHVVYNFVGEKPDGRVEATERAAFSAVRDALVKTGGLSKQDALRIIKQHYTPEITAILFAHRKQMLRRVQSLRGKAQTGSLSVSYSDAGALDRFKKYLATSLSREALPFELTASLALMSYKPATDLTWVFCEFQAPRVINGFLSGRARIKRLTPIVAVGSAAFSLDLGHFEIFSDFPSVGIDPDFDQALTDLDEGLARRGLSVQQRNRELAGVLMDSAMIRYQSLDPTTPDDDHTMGIVNAQEIHGQYSASCVSCHIVTGQRERLDLSLTSRLRELGLHEIEGNRPFSRAKIGPIALEQGDQVPGGGFKQTWNLRGFGYYGDVPSIMDRVITETHFDVRYANRLFP